MICRQAPGQHPGLQLQTHIEHNTATKEYLDQAEKSDRGWNKVGIGGKIIGRELFKWVILDCQRS